jgi:hypothetical protein
MAEVQIGSETYFVYADVPDADAYMEASVGAAADAWRDADEVSKARALVSGTRAIDAQSWKGEKTVADQEGDFPRTGLTYPDGSAVDPDEVPPEVVVANIELAAMLNAGESIDPSAARQTTARRLKAGSVEIENFRQFGLLGVFPSSIMRLLGFWLAGTGGIGFGGSEAYGTCGRSAFRRPQYKPSRGF